jgi:hypothetical protein
MTASPPGLACAALPSEAQATAPDAAAACSSMDAGLEQVRAHGGKFCCWRASHACSSLHPSCSPSSSSHSPPWCSPPKHRQAPRRWPARLRSMSRLYALVRAPSKCMALQHHCCPPLLLLCSSLRPYVTSHAPSHFCPGPNGFKLLKVTKGSGSLDVHFGEGGVQGCKAWRCGIIAVFPAA